MVKRHLDEYIGGQLPNITVYADKPWRTIIPVSGGYDFVAEDRGKLFADYIDNLFNPKAKSKISYTPRKKFKEGGRHLDEVDSYDYIASNSNLPEIVVTAPRKRNILREWWDDISNYDFGKDIKDAFKDNSGTRHFIADLQNFGIIPKGSEDKNYSYGVMPMTDKIYGTGKINSTIGDYVAHDLSEFEQNLKYAQLDDIVKAQQDYIDFINSPQYRQRLADAYAKENIRTAMREVSLNRHTDPNIVTRMGKFREYYKKHPKNLKDYFDLVKDNYYNRLRVQEGNPIRVLTKNGNIVEKTSKGVYDKNTKNIYVALGKDAENTVQHETAHAMFDDIFYERPRYINDSDIKLAFDYDEPLKRYYGNVNEARSRIMPILTQMYKEGYPLNYKGFNDMIRAKNISYNDFIYNNYLSPYDKNTIRHLINGIYKLGGRISLKSGGTIHINPENRGKFNATKERTGKTTEELTHSKNPLTRKRAIFAQNAAKWKH